MYHNPTAFYKMLFEQSPVSIWVEDFTGVVEFIERHKELGVKDFRAYFMTYPEKLLECVSQLKVVDVNDTTLQTYKARDKQTLVRGLPLIFRDEAIYCLMESTIALSENKTHFDGQGINYDLQGNKLMFRISWNIPGPEMSDYKNVIVVMQDYTRLDQVRRELEESESLFRSIFEQSSEGLVLLDSQGSIRLVNQSFSSIIGAPQVDMAGKAIWDIYAKFASENSLDRDLPLTADSLRVLLEHPEPEQQVYEYSFRDSRSKYHVHKLTIQPIQVNDQRLFTMVLTDLSAFNRSELVTTMLHRISHAVNAEVSLDELFHIIHESMGRLLDVSNFYIALYDSKSRLITFPYVVDEFEDDSPISIDFADSLTAQIISGAQTLLLEEEEVHQRTGLDYGDSRLAKNYLGAPLILSGNVIGALAVQSYTLTNLYTEEDRLFLESISEQIAFALHKKQSDENITVLIQAIEQAGEGIAIFSAQGFIYYVNTVFEKSIGYSRAELLDKPLEFLPFDRNSRKEMQTSWMRVRSSQPWRGKVDMIRKDGSKITLDMVVKPVIDHEGHLSSIIASCKDVTYEILREEQLKRTQRLEAIGRLTGGIAHDFNNVLSAVIGYTELAAEDLDPYSDSAQKLVEVLKSANRAKEMIAHLISFSRQEEARTELIELVDHVKESVRFLGSYLPKNIEIAESYQVPNSTVMAVPGQVHQIVINLGTNAMHAIGQKQGHLEISVDQISFLSKDMVAFPELDQCEYLRIIVRDNGCGIEENLIQHIFDPYFTTKRSTEGTGLGLSIVHSIVQAHRGAIRVESTVGVGTAFCIYLPVYKADRSIKPVEETIIDEEVSGVENIMFVDDEPMLVNVFKQGLSRLGFNVEGFTDPRKALEYFDRNHHRVDMVLTDTTMPYMNGVDLAEKMLAIDPRMPIIICTGFTTLISAEGAKQLGIRDFVMKPFKIKEIAQLIRDILDKEEKINDADRFAPE